VPGARNTDPLLPGQDANLTTQQSLRFDCLVLYRLESMKSQVKREAEKDAAKLLKATWGGAIPVDPVAIARTAGLSVLEAHLDENTLGALVKQPGRDPTILLNEADSENRRRFTCAHELGHFVRRSEEADEYTRVDLRNSLSARGEDPEEVYANEFAACLLMPEDEVRSFVETGMGDLEMAIRFKVSREAMQFRLKNLELMAAVSQPA
jgi:Zn-dependent peptidase ImmA (M78 family)